MTDLEKLAERCEQATGPDRELDVDITCAAYKWLRGNDYILPAPSGGGRCVHYYTASGTHGTSPAPRYTGQIETVLRHLVTGELWGFEVTILGDDRWSAELSTDAGDGYCRAGAATKELALCAAALRARAASADRSPKGQDGNRLDAQHESAVPLAADAQKEPS